ncbi:hypothetical protein IM538_12925 [Cytobacillus suaedae]|nr:hypothetical protein IM538_12925 [Cytobacillus suaedae]
MKYLQIFLLLILLVSCSSPVTSFEGYIQSVDQNIVRVDCSNAVNRDKKGAIEAIAYYCSVRVTKDTIIINNDKEIDIEDLKIDQRVKVVLIEEKNISEDVDSREVAAKEILIIN